MQWVTEIKDVRCERKNHNILTLRTLMRKVTYRNDTLIFVMKPAAFMLGLRFIGVSLEHYHKYVA